MSGHAPADAIVVPDAHFLFNADFKRSGVDLILSGDDREVVFHDYFKGEKRAALASPDGAHLTGDIVNALTGHVEVSQAGGGAVTGQVIGHLTKLVGNATATRNGVSIILNNGDNVEKGDVVQSGSDSTVGITFMDGTVFGLSSNARMVLNDMVYDPNGSNNSSLMSLVAGTISFVAGQTAKHGDMKIDTPVATMGIRGTAVLVQIDFAIPGQNGAPNASFQVLVEPDGTTGSYVLFDKTTLQPIAMVNQAGQQININNGVISQSNAPLSPDVQKLIQDVFTQKFTDNSNTKQTSPFNDTLSPFQQGSIIKLADGSTATSTFVVVIPQESSQQNSNGPLNQGAHIPGPPAANILDDFGNLTKSFSVGELVGKTGDAGHDSVGGTVRFVDINPGDQPTVKVDFSSFSFQSANSQGAPATLSALQLADIAATEVKIDVVASAGNKNTGSATWTYSIADKAFDFLAAGEQLTLTYMVRVDNNFAPNNETAFIPITITITGTNDAPVVTTSAQTVTFLGGTSVSGGTLTTTDPTSGTLSFQDADLTDTHTVSAELTSANLDGSTVPPGPLALFENALTASIATDSTGTGSGTIDWKLGSLPVYVADFIPKGETLKLTYTVTVTDSQNATSTQTVTVEITGTDNAAVVWIATSTDGSSSGGFWSDGANWETGTVPTANDDAIIITDQLIGLTPSFPVTINAPAFAKSVTMNDFDDSPPELINLDSLTIGDGGISLGADSILHNSGIITVAGAAEILGHSVVVNSGTLELAAGGDFKDDSSITNAETGTIVVSGGTLNVQVDIANAGEITVDAGATFALKTGAIDGGTVTINGAPVVQDQNPDVQNADVRQGGAELANGDGVLNLQGSAVLKNGILSNGGQINVTGIGNAFDDETVTANKALEIFAGGLLLLELGSSIANAGGLITVDSTATLALNDASIDGGTVTVNGTLELEGSSFLKSGSLDNSNEVTISGSTNAFDGETVINTQTGAIDVTGVLTLDLGTSITGGKLTNSGTIHVESMAGATFNGVDVDNAGGAIQVDSEDTPSPPPAKLTLDGGTTLTSGTLTIGIAGTLEVSTEFGATLTDVTVDNSGIVQVDEGSVLTLVSTTVSGGTLTDYGTIHVTGTSAITDANIEIASTGLVEVTGGVLTIDPDAPVGIINYGTLEANGGELDIVSEGVTNTGTLQAIDDSILKLVSLTVTNDEGTVSAGLASTLDLVDSIIKGGAIHVIGTLDATGTSAIEGAAITNTGILEVTGGTLTIDAASHLDNTGMVEANGGTLIIDTALSGSAEITGASILELGANSLDAYKDAEITFSDGSTGTLKIDHSENFAGAVSGVDDNTLDLRDIKWGSHTTVAFTGDASGGTLTIVDSDDPTEVAHIHLDGDYLGSSWSVTSDGAGGTDVTEVPGVLSGLDSHGNAIAGKAITASITDGGETVTNASYTFETSGDGGHTWKVVESGASNVYTPTVADEGQQLRVLLSFTDADGHQETSSVSGGTVQEPPDAHPVILSETNPSVQTIILAESPIVLPSAATTNALGLPTETFDEVGAGLPSNNGQGHGNFSSSALNALFIASGHAGVVTGSSPSASAAPFVGPLPGHQDTTNYLSIGTNGSETIQFATEQNAFGLDWGSVDSFNKVDFYHGTTLVASYSGADISPLLASGGQGSFASNGYVEFKDLAPFDKVVLSSGGSAFEVDNISSGYIADSHIHLAEPITGTMTVSDADVGDTLTGLVTGAATIKYNGSTSLPSGVDVAALVNPSAVTFDSTTSDGKADVLHWTYNPASPNLDFLEPGDTLTITFNAQVSDGHVTAGNQPLTITLTGTGSSVVNGTAQNDVFVHVGGGATIFGHGGNDTFVFNANFGTATIGDFDVNHDTINLDHSLFSSVQAFLNSAQSANGGHDAIITDANHDKIMLTGVSVADLKAHPTDFHLV